MEDSATETDDQLTSSGRNSPPILPQDSPGSSVSIRLQEEYSELLKYTVNSVTLNGDGLEPGESLELATAVPSSINLNNNRRDETIETCAPRDSSRQQTCVDTVVQNMGSKMDGLLATLKEKLLGELTKELLTAIESQQQAQKIEMKELTSEKACLEKEINRLNEVINCMEQSISRKDCLIDNQSECLSAQKGKTELAQKFYSWKASHLDKKREDFTEKLAVQHHNENICHKVFKSWFGVIQQKWRCKVERSCQEQAQGVCMQLSKDYESKVCVLNETVKCLEAKLADLQAEREVYADQVKKAFMRGVCALNMEAMAAFNPDQQQSETSFFDTDADTTKSQDLTYNNYSKNLKTYEPMKDSRPSKSLPPELTAVSSSDLLDCPDLKEEERAMSTPPGYTVQMAKPKSCSVFGKTKPLASCTKQRSNQQILAPPMASVVVEKHQPVTKKTIGKATAVRYPRKIAKDNVTKGGCSHKAPGTSSALMGPHFKLLAGQTAHKDLMKTHAMNIKVVD